MSLFHVPTILAPLRGDAKMFTTAWLQLFTNLGNLLNRGYPPSLNNAQGQAVAQSTTIPVAKLTPGGADGSFTFTNGILTSAVPPT